MDGLFDGLEVRQREPLDTDTFKQEIVQRYAEQASSIGIDACIGEAVDAVWPAPEYREHQRQAVVDLLHELYVDDNDVVTLSAPTGAGKSLILHAAIRVLDNEFGRKSFFTTPLNALIDQIDDDEFIGDNVLTLKGKNNYTCVHRQDRGAPVDKAVCQRDDDFECQHKQTPPENGGCPYYGRKAMAHSHPEVVTNLPYLMANSMIPETIDSKLQPREMLVIDECQSIEDFALQFVEVTVSDDSIPEVVLQQIDEPPRTDDIEPLLDWLRETVMPEVNLKLSELDERSRLSESEADMEEDLQQFARKVRNLVNDVADHHWVVNSEFDGPDFSVEFKPIFVGRFLDSYLWSQGNKTILSSATIPKSGFLEEIGLDDRDVGRVEVPSTFPTERRPVYTDDTVGKMTKAKRDSTIPQMAERIADIADEHEGQRGFVHCHSYGIMQRLYDALPGRVKTRTTCQDGDDREVSLDDWLAQDIDDRGYADDEGGQIFLSVAMDEGISLDDWRARWQVIAKAAYPFMGAERVQYRMDKLNDWNWYAGTAAINLQQAVGRGMRSKDDWCQTYVLDTSAATLIERNEHLFEDWFLDSVDEQSGEDLPERY
jgi:Rad3-related DNA helicase